MGTRSMLPVRPGRARSALLQGWSAPKPKEAVAPQRVGPPGKGFADVPLFPPSPARTGEPRPVQRKGAVSSPGDPFEREADAVADRVLRGAAPGVAHSAGAGHALMRKCAKCEDDENHPVQAKRAHAEATAAPVEA